MIAVDLHPVNIVTGLGFKEMMNFFDPTYKIPHPTTFMRTHLPNLLEDVAGQVMGLMKPGRHITLTTDCWQDDYAKNHYMTVSAHFVDESWEFLSFILATVALEGSITGELINQNLEAIKNQFSLHGKTFSLVTDQGSNVLKAGRIGDYHQLECFAHRLDLCLTTYGIDLTPAWSSVLKKCIGITNAFRQRRPEFRAEQQAQQRLFQEYLTNVVENDHCYASVTQDPGTTALKR